MRSPLVTVRVPQEIRDWLDSEDNVSKTVGEALQALRRSRESSASDSEPEPVQSPPNEPAADPAAAPPAPDVEAILAKLLSSRRLLRPLTEVVADLAPRVFPGKTGELAFDPGDGGELVRLDDEALAYLIATDTPAVGSGGSGGRSRGAARAPARPAEPKPFGGLVHFDGETARIDVDAYSKLSPKEQRKLQEGS